MQKPKAIHYDFIVTGAGAAGRSFVYQLLQSPLKSSRVLLIDQERKQADDRTWCFWESSPGPFEEIVHYKWPSLWFHSEGFSNQMDIQPFTYKMVRAADYYSFTDKAFAQYGNVEVLIADVHQLEQAAKENKATVKTSAGNFTADWIVNSIWRGEIDKSKVQYLDQHFRGWFVQSADPIFSDEDATLMDFRIPQEDDFRFMYVFPDSPHTALFELAIFSNDHLSVAGYDEIIEGYIKSCWPQLKDYQVERTEQGVIPMTDYAFPTNEHRIIHVGTAGGDTRASTGYTFIYIHRRIERLIKALAEGDARLGTPTWFEQRHRFYDSLMLKVLAEKRYPGAKLFSRLFEANPPARLLRFLNGESSFPEELALMSTTPIPVFMRALLEK